MQSICDGLLSRAQVCQLFHQLRAFLTIGTQRRLEVRVALPNVCGQDVYAVPQLLRLSLQLFLLLLQLSTATARHCTLSPPCPGQKMRQGCQVGRTCLTFCSAFSRAACSPESPALAEQQRANTVEKDALCTPAGHNSTTGNRLSAITSVVSGHQGTCLSLRRASPLAQQGEPLQPVHGPAEPLTLLHPSSALQDGLEGCQDVLRQQAVFTSPGTVASAEYQLLGRV